MKYSVEVYEMREYKVEYVVEADSEEEAIEAACNGDTEDEHNVQLIGVTNREVDRGTVQACTD